MADYSNLVQFFTGSALPASPVANGIYFIVKDNVGTLYKGDVKIAETNDNVRIANIEQSIVDINTELAKKATKQELADHIELYEALLNVVQGHTTDIKAISDKVGTVPEGSTVMGIIKDIQDNAYDDTALRGEIEQSLNLKADKEQVAKDIAAAVKVEEEARIAAVSGVQGEVDALEELHAKDKKDLSDAIALKADQTALDAVSNVANAAATQTALQGEIDRAKGEEARIEGLVTAETQRATGIESGLRKDVDAIKGDYLKAADKTELSEAIAAEKERAEGIEESLQTQINTIMNNPDAEGAINSINEFTQYVAEHGTIAEGFRTDISALKEVVPTLETKEDATAKYNEVKAEIAAIPQADWNQSDETAPDYIKNRTHYEDGKRTVIAEYSLANLYNASMGMRYLDLEDGVYESLPPQTELKLEVDGIVYSSLTINDNYQYEHVTINGYTDVKVTISSYRDGAKIGFYNLYGKDVSDCTIRLVTDNVTIKQLDEKFIPYTIARTVNLDYVTDRVRTIEEKLADIETSADANIIETVKVNGVALEVSEDKSVDISVPTGALASKNEVAEADLASALAEKINAKADQSALEEAVETLEQAIEDCGADAEAKIDAALYVGEGESKVEKYALATALAAEVERAEGVESQLLAALTWQNA